MLGDWTLGAFSPPPCGASRQLLNQNWLKRVKIIILVLVLLVLLSIFLFTRVPGHGANLPYFVVARSQPVGPFGSEYLNWNAAVPIRDGKLWLLTFGNGTNFHSFQYDVDHGKVLGELFNSYFALANQDQTKLLCCAPDFPLVSLKARLIAFFSRISHGKINIPTNRIECYWFLDTRNSSVRPAGQLSQIPGAGSSWQQSPDGRCGFDVPANSEKGKAFFFCDLEEQTFKKVKFVGSLQGWWDNQNILAKDPAGNLILFNVQTRKTSILFSLEALKRRFQELQIPDKPADLRTKFNWNGRGYDVYLGGKDAWTSSTNASFVIRIVRSGPRLELVQHDFQFKWLGRLNAAGNLYVYPGESGSSGASGNGGVFLRDLSDNSVHTVVLPDKSGSYSLPCFYGDSIIYFHMYNNNRVLWRVGLDGSNATRLFTPATLK